MARPPARRPLRWFWYPTLLALGPFGWLTLALVARTPRMIAGERLAALPFPVTHDRPANLDGWGWSAPLAGATITLRCATDRVEAELLARRAEAAAPGLAVRITGATITLAPRGSRGEHIVQLADLLSGWGVELHASHGIAGMTVAWLPRSGPPPSI